MKLKLIDLRWNFWDFWFHVFNRLTRYCLDKQKKICEDHRKYLEEQANE